MIRKAIFNDIEKIVSLEESTLGSSLGSEMLNSYLTNPLAVILVDEEEELVSYISIVFDGDIVEILNICVNSKFQGQGYGKKLLSYIENMFYSLKAKSIFLEVNEHNFKAISLYEKFGFKQINLRKNYYGNNSAYVLEYKYTRQEVIERKYLEIFTEASDLTDRVEFTDQNNPLKYYHNFTYYKKYSDEKRIYDEKQAKELNKERFIFATSLELELAGYEIDYLRLMHQSIHSLNLKSSNHNIVFLDESRRESYLAYLYQDSLIYGSEYSKRNALAHVNACLDEKKLVIILALNEQQEIIGSVDLFCFKNCCKIEDFCVQDAYQKQGYGYCLLAFARNYLLVKEITDLYLICDDKDVYKDMYKRMGFSVENLYCFCRKEFNDGKN